MNKINKSKNLFDFRLPAVVGSSIFDFLFSIVIFVIFVIPTVKADFTDVAGTHANSEAINYVQSQNIVSGYDNGTFKPDITINRAEFTKIIISSNFSQSEIDNCIADNSKPGWTYMFFPDVPITEWFAKYICVAKLNNIIIGYPDGTFKPDNQINFAESAKIIVSTFKYPVSTDAVWYKPFAEKLSSVSAIPVTVTSINKLITRGEMAEMVYRLKAEVTDKSSMEVAGTDLIAPESTASNAFNLSSTESTSSSQSTPASPSIPSAPSVTTPTPAPAPAPTPTPPPAPVTSAYTPTYYVGKTNCSDSGSGAMTQPFCKVQIGLNKLKAGDVLMILNGIYKERVYLSASGTQGNPIVITGESVSGAILDAGCPSFPCPYSQIGTFPLWEDAGDNISGFVINNQNYITLDGFTMQNTPDNGIEANTTTGLTIKNMIIKNSVASLVNIYDSKGLKVSDNTLSGSHMGRISLSGEYIQINPEEAMSIVNTDGFDIYNNSLSDGMKEGITLKVGSKNGKVHNNDIKRLCAVGIYVDEGSYIDIYENTVSDIGFVTKDGTVKRCDDVITGTVKFEGAIDGDINTYDANAYEQGTGIMMATGDIGDLAKGKVTDVKIYKNIIKDINVGCVSIWDQIRDSGSGAVGSLENIQIYNNDFYNCAKSKANWGPGVIVSPSAKDTKIWNNIIMLTSEPIDDQGSNTDISNNLLYEAGGLMGNNSVTSDPMFTNAGSGDFKLKSGSPAIDKGKNAGLPYNGFAPDIGAIEY